MAKSKTKTPSEGFAPITLLFVFLTGLFLVPAFLIMNYEVHVQDSGAIHLHPVQTEPIRSDLPEKSVEVVEPAPVSQPVAPPQKAPVEEPASLNPSKPKDPDARAKWLVKKAVLDFNRKNPDMQNLDLFLLIGQGYLKEIPNCSNNGLFLLRYQNDQVVIECRPK